MIKDMAKRVQSSLSPFRRNFLRFLRYLRENLTDEPHTMEQLKRQLMELQKECQKLSSEIGAFKQEKQKQKKDSPRTPLQKKEKIKEKNDNNDSKMGLGKEPETHSQKGRKKGVVPPTLEEVQAYMDQKGESSFTNHKA